MAELKITSIDISPRMMAECLAQYDSETICEFIRDMLDQGDLFDPDLRYWLIDGLQGDLDTAEFMKKLKTKTD